MKVTCDLLLPDSTIVWTCSGFTFARRLYGSAIVCIKSECCADTRGI